MIPWYIAVSTGIKVISFVIGFGKTNHSHIYIKKYQFELFTSL